MKKSQKERKAEAELRVPRYLPGQIDAAGRVVKRVIWSNTLNDFVYTV